MANRAETSQRALVAIVVAGWLALVIVPPAGLAWWRAGRLAELAEPAVQAEWNAFREAMRQQTGRAGPVQRKVPKSEEPPERVWLRDRFWLAVSAWVVLGGTLGGFFAGLVLGVAASRTPAPPVSDPGSAGPSGQR